MFPTEQEVITKSFESSSTFLLQLQIQVSTVKRLILGACLFTRFDVAGINDAPNKKFMFIDFIAVDPSKPSGNILDFKRLSWKGKGIAKLMVSIIQSFANISFDKKSMELRVRCGLDSSTFFSDNGFMEDELNENDYPELIEHINTMLLEQRNYTKALCLYSESTMNYHGRTFIRKADVFVDELDIDCLGHFYITDQMYNLLCCFAEVNYQNTAQEAMNRVAYLSSSQLL